MLEIKVDEDPPTIDLCDTVEECADLAIQQIDDGTRKDSSNEIRKALVTRRSWSGPGIGIAIRKR